MWRARPSRDRQAASLEPELTSGAVSDGSLGKVLVSADDIAARVADLGEEISRDYAGRRPILVGVLKGAFVFMSDLARAIDLPVEFDFMAVSSYGAATQSSGIVRILKDLDAEILERDVLLVEDIIDSGLTLSYLRRNLATRRPSSLEVCALLVKEGAQPHDPDIRYEGFRIPPSFVVGYGLDAKERYRNLRDVVEYLG